MTTHTVWSGGERGGKAPPANLRLRANEICPRGVLRRFGRRLAISFARANERPVRWGDDPRSAWRRIEWRIVVDIVVFVALLGLAAHVGWLWAAAR